MVQWTEERAFRPHVVAEYRLQSVDEWRVHPLDVVQRFPALHVLHLAMLRAQATSLSSHAVAHLLLCALHGLARWREDYDQVMNRLSNRTALRPQSLAELRVHAPCASREHQSDGDHVCREVDECRAQSHDESHVDH